MTTTSDNDPLDRSDERGERHDINDIPSEEHPRTENMLNRPPFRRLWQAVFELRTLRTRCSKGCATAILDESSTVHMDQSQNDYKTQLCDGHVDRLRSEADMLRL